MFTVHTAPEDARFQAFYDLGIFTVTDLCRYAEVHGLRPTDVLEAANV